MSENVGSKTLKYFDKRPFDFFYKSCRENDQLPPESRITDQETFKWPRAWGATMSRAQDGHIINSNFALSGPNPGKIPKGWLLFLESVSKFLEVEIKVC